MKINQNYGKAGAAILAAMFIQQNMPAFLAWLDSNGFDLCEGFVHWMNEQKFNLECARSVAPIHGELHEVPNKGSEEFPKWIARNA